MLPMLLPLALALVLAEPTSKAPMNVQSVTCLAADHALAGNQRWAARALAEEEGGASAGAPHPGSAALPLAAPPATCPTLKHNYCCSSNDILPQGKSNMTLDACCELCHTTTGCVGIVLTTHPGDAVDTCYPKTALNVDCGAGICTTGSMAGVPIPSGPAPPHPPPVPPPSPGPPPPPSPAIGAPVQLVHHASGLCLESHQPGGNVEVAPCEAVGPGVSPSQRFQFHADETITDGYGTCLSIDSNAHGVGANVAASNISCVASKCGPGHTCTKWTRGAGGNISHPQGGAVGPAGCLDVGSGGSFSDGSDVRFEPAALAAPSGPAQAYCNASAPSWVRTIGLNLIEPDLTRPRTGLNRLRTVLQLMAGRRCHQDWEGLPHVDADNAELLGYQRSKHGKSVCQHWPHRPRDIALTHVTAQVTCR